MAKVILAQVGRGSDQPCLFVLLAFKARVIPHQAQEGILHHILGVMAVFHVHEANTVYRFDVAVIDS